MSWRLRRLSANRSPLHFRIQQSSRYNNCFEKARGFITSPLPDLTTSQYCVNRAKHPSHDRSARDLTPSLLYLSALQPSSVRRSYRTQNLPCNTTWTLNHFIPPACLCNQANPSSGRRHHYAVAWYKSKAREMDRTRLSPCPFSRLQVPLRCLSYRQVTSFSQPLTLKTLSSARVLISSSAHVQG